MDISTFCKENLCIQVLSARGTYGHKCLLQGDPEDISTFCKEDLCTLILSAKGNIWI